jgi:predicted nucleic acid-binding protein
MTKSGRLDLRNITEADVYIGDDLAAHLVRGRSDTISFSYIADQRSTEPGIRERSVSWSLLRSDEYPIVSTGGAVPPFFGSTAEGQRRDAVHAGADSIRAGIDPGDLACVRLPRVPTFAGGAAAPTERCRPHRGFVAQFRAGRTTLGTLIYLDTSATVKLVAAEEESAALIDWLNAHADENLVTSAVGHIELIRAAARIGPNAVSLARNVASTIDTLVLTNAIASAAATTPPFELRTLDAIHLATAHIHRKTLTAFCAYDRRLLKAAESHGLPVVSPRGQADAG